MVYSLSLSPAARGPDSGMRPPQRPGDQVHSVPPAMAAANAAAAERLAGPPPRHWQSRRRRTLISRSIIVSTGPSVASASAAGDSETLQVAMGRVSWIMSVFRVRVSVTAPATPARPTPGAPSRVGRPRTQAPCPASVSPVAHPGPVSLSLVAHPSHAPLSSQRRPGRQAATSAPSSSALLLSRRPTCPPVCPALGGPRCRRLRVAGPRGSPGEAAEGPAARSVALLQPRRTVVPGAGLIRV